MTFAGFTDVELAPDTSTYQSLLIQSTQQAVEIGEAIEIAANDGKIAAGGGLKMATYPDGTLGWILQLTIDGVLYTGYQYDWLVKDSAGNLSIWHGGSPDDWAGINPEYASKFTVPSMIWAATSSAPVATAGAGGIATIVFPQPTSVNAPFAYRVTQTDTTADATGVATLSGEPDIDDDGSVTLTVTGLTEGNEYTFELSVDTAYDGITATALPTAAITAAA